MVHTFRDHYIYYWKAYFLLANCKMRIIYFALFHNLRTDRYWWNFIL